jgi:hypothetical protein
LISCSISAAGVNGRTHCAARAKRRDIEGRGVPTASENWSSFSGAVGCEHVAHGTSLLSKMERLDAKIIRFSEATYRAACSSGSPRSDRARVRSVRGRAVSRTTSPCWWKEGVIRSRRPAPTSDHRSQVSVKCETQAREDDQQGAGDVRPARKREGESDAAQSADPAEGERIYVTRKQREGIRLS